MKKYKIVVYVPELHADTLREAIGRAGAGEIRTYTQCTFSVKGTTRFVPGEGSNPSVGEIGKLQEVEEERIETVCAEEKLKSIIATIKAAHPYEEPAMDVYPIELVD